MYSPTLDAENANPSYILYHPGFLPPLGFTQQVTAISQAPGFSSLASCAQNVAVGVIDDSNSPECPGGSPLKCFCGAEVASREYSDQISTNVLNDCLTSPGPKRHKQQAFLPLSVVWGLRQQWRRRRPLRGRENLASFASSQRDMSSPLTDTRMKVVILQHLLRF